MSGTPKPEVTPAEPEAPPPVSGLRGFVLLWAGQVASLLGTAMTRFALMLWGWEKTGEATTLALLGFFGIGTTVLLSPIAGVVADRLDRKVVMVLSDLGAGLTTVVLLLLHQSGNLEIWHIYTAAVAAGAFETFQFPAYSASITLLVPSRHYTRAGGLISLAETASRAFGPPVAAVLLPQIGYRGIFTVDLCTLSLAIVLLLLVRLPKPEVSEAGRQVKAGLWRETAFGFSYILARRGLLALQLCLAATNFLGAFVVTLRSPMILARTGSDAQILGNVQAVAGVGGILGGLLLASWGGPRQRVRGFLGGMLLAMVGNFILGIGPGPLLWAVGAFLFPFALTFANASNQAIWQAKVEPDVQGKVFAVRRQIAQITALPAMLLAGPLADRVFEPALARTGDLAAGPGAWLSRIFGSGPGAGMALLIALTSAAGIAVALFAARLDAVRRVEELHPDHKLARAGR